MPHDNRSALEKVLEAWNEGKFRGAGNMGTDGVYVYSYSEPIASRTEGGEVLVLESGVFSQTTSKHCSAVAGACKRVRRVSQDCVKARRLNPTAADLKEYESIRKN